MSVGSEGEQHTLGRGLEMTRWPHRLVGDLSDYELVPGERGAESLSVLLAFAVAVERSRHVGGEGPSWGCLRQGPTREAPLKRAGTDTNAANPPPAKAPPRRG